MKLDVYYYATVSPVFRKSLDTTEYFPLNGRVGNVKKAVSLSKPQTQYVLQLGAKGRIVLPAKVRKRLDLKEGEKLVLTMRPDGTLTLESSGEQVRKTWGAFAKKDGRSLVDELIRERRAEGEKE